MMDFKDYGLSRDQRLDDIATAIAWLVATALVIFYGLGATP